MSNPETELRALWAEKGIPAERQDEILAEIAAAARPGARVGPFVIPLPRLTCRKCGRVNPAVYLAPVAFAGDPEGTCICFDCTDALGWLDRDGNLKPGIEL